VKENFGKAFGIGLAAVAVVVGAVLFLQRGAHVELPGTMRVRTVGTGEHESLVLADLHLTNPSDYTFEIKNVTVILENKDGQFPHEIVSKSDAQRLFDSLPDAGPFHAPLYTKATIPPHTTGDYTVAAPFSAPERILKDRKRFIVRIEETNGTAIDFSEK